MKQLIEEHPCKRWFWYKHQWRKCWYSEYVGHPVEINSMLCGTRKCDKCGTIESGWADAENWQPKEDNFAELDKLKKHE